MGATISGAEELPGPTSWAVHEDSPPFRVHPSDTLWGGPGTSWATKYTSTRGREMVKGRERAGEMAESTGANIPATKWGIRGEHLGDSSK